MSSLKLIETIGEIPDAYKETPISKLIEYHNLGRSFDLYARAELLIGMCMDHRKHLRIPDNFSYIIRSGGANLRFSEFKVSYAIGVGGVKHIALIGHDNCGMVDLQARREQFVLGMKENAGWDIESADDFFGLNAPLFEIGNEVFFVAEEAKRLRLRYPKVMVAAFIYKVETGKLWIVNE